jgi:hypothetical protein
MGNDGFNLKALRSRVISGIQKEERQRARMFLFGSAFTALLAGAGFFGSVKYLIAESAQSPLWTHISMIFTDADIVLANFRMFFFSLAEALPLFGITVLFATVFFFLSAVRLFVLNSGSAYINHKI